MALVAWYKLNGNVLDSTVNGNHGTIVGSPTIVNDGPFGSCYLFNPDNNDRITINNLSQFIYNTPFTFSAWIKTSGLGTGQTVNGIVSLTYGTRFCGNSAGNIYIHFSSTSIGSYSITSSGININDNMWHHVCVTYDGDILKLYIDGVLNNSSVTGIVQTNTHTNNGAIGLDVNDSSKYKFNGSISDVRIYDEALSLKEIKELSKAKVLHYDFNQYQEPTTNIAPYTDYSNRTYNNDYTASSWGGDLATITYYQNGGYDNLPYKKMIKTTGGTGGSFLDDNIPITITNNTTYTISVYMKASTNVTLDPYCLCINRIADNAYRTAAVNFYLTTTWQRYSWTYTSGSDHAGTYQSRHIIYIDNDLPIEIYWCGFQIEQKDHVTPFVNGTRTAKVYDKSGYNNNAELTEATAPTYVNESIVNNGCYEFDGIDDFIQIPTLNINNNNKFTISFWCYCADTGVRDIFFGNYSLSNNFNIERTTSNTLRFWYTTGSVDITIPTFTLPSLEWINITIVYSSTGFKAYKNGILIYENQTLNLTANVFSNVQYIGRDTRTGTTAFKGKLADFRIYSTALSEDDIKEIYQTRASIDENGNLYCGNINNGYMIWDSEINSINLVTNGSAELEDNTNFTSFNYITTDSYDGTGCLSRTGVGTLYSNEYIKIDKYNGSYYLSGYFKSAGSSGLNSRLYFGIACFDYLKRLINPDMVSHYTNTETTLAQPLNNGDTIVYLTSASNWHTSASAKSTRKLGVYYNEIDVYPKYTYTRSTVYYTEADLINNTITLTTAWSGGTIPSGTYVANHYDSGTYLYIAASNASIPFTWTKYTSINAISGWSINNSYSYFRYGTEYIKLLFLSNYGQDSTYTTLMDNLKFWNTKAENKVVNINIEKTSNIVATKFSEVGITEGLVAYYPLNGDAKDYSGNNNHGTVYGAIKASGIAGKKCYSFDGVNYIYASDNLGTLHTSFSISLWTKAIPKGNFTYIIHRGGSSIGPSIYHIGENNTGNFIANVNGTYANMNTGVPVDTDWHHIVLTYDGNIEICYIDDVEKVRYTVGVITNDWTDSIVGIAASNPVSTSRNFQGKIQDIRIYNRALSDKEIGILYNTFNPNINKTLQINKENIIYTKGNIKEV